MIQVSCDYSRRRRRRRRRKRGCSAVQEVGDVLGGSWTTAVVSRQKLLTTTASGDFRPTWLPHHAQFIMRNNCVYFCTEYMSMVAFHLDCCSNLFLVCKCCSRCPGAPSVSSSIIPLCPLAIGNGTPYITPVRSARRTTLIFSLFQSAPHEQPLLDTTCTSHVCCSPIRLCLSTVLLHQGWLPQSQ
jgi:hypothetical protein